MIDRVPIVDEPKVEPFFRERVREGRGLLGETIRNFFFAAFCSLPNKFHFYLPSLFVFVAVGTQFK